MCHKIEMAKNGMYEIYDSSESETAETGNYALHQNIFTNVRVFFFLHAHFRAAFMSHRWLRPDCELETSRVRAVIPLCSMNPWGTC